MQTLMGMAAVLAEDPKSTAPVMIIGVLIFLAVFFLFSQRGRKRQQQDRDKMINDLARNTRVVTLGGMIGVVIDVKDDEITIKIDESNNTKIRMKKWAIRSVIPKDGSGEADDSR
ncbi:MAG: hypothetical protein BIFFINMI_02633 [Phycisphaerae bacterium]|nr:hypothetical protein [Phycisphaerae bacterium]